MSTKIEELYPAIRALVGDNDAVRFLYSDATLDQHIMLFVDCNATLGIAVAGVEGERTITLSGSALTGATRATVILNAARSLISPTPDYMQFSGPVFSSARRGAATQVLANIDRMLAMLRSGHTISWETELEHFYVGDQRLTAAASAAQGANTSAGNPTS